MKALAITQTILLVMAIFVLALISYLVYTQYIAGSEQFDKSKCQSSLVSICTACKTCVTGLGGEWSDNICPRDSRAACDKLCERPVNCPKLVLGACSNQYVDTRECASIGIN